MNSDAGIANMGILDNHMYVELFSDIFGDSDADADDDPCSEDCYLALEFVGDDELAANRSDRWMKVEEVEGLWHCGQFLSPQQQLSLSEAIAAEEWFPDPQHNQAMRFGDLPRWADDLCELIRNSIRSCTATIKEHNWDASGPLPVQLLEREPLFDQMIANSYQPGEGIKAHVDLARFEDGIAIVSLESTCVMTFAFLGDSAGNAENVAESKLDETHLPVTEITSVKQSVSNLLKPHEKTFVRERDTVSGMAKRVDVLLSPGDLIVASGPARYQWTHEINRSKDQQVWLGQAIEQHRRISVTLRRLCTDRDID